MKIKSNNIRILFYSIWLISAIIQSFWTEILADEAYYWKYAQFLDWGYFDHPPIIALMIKLGYAMFANELGVRIFAVIANLATIFCLEKIVRPKDVKLFYVMIASIGILHFISFNAIPDVPFLLMAACFYLLYRRFLIHPDWKISIALGLNIGLMLLSKYHGILIVVFTLLSHLKIVKSLYFWLILLIGLAILTPHIVWQFENDFPSLKYHFFERSREQYSLSYTLEYLITQPFIFGPFMGILLLLGSYKYQIQNQFENTLKWNLWGGYLFFFLMTFKGHIEAHWTLFIILPSFYFGYRYISDSEKLKKWVYKLFPFTIVLIIMARLLIIIDVLPLNIYTNWINDHYHGKKEWAKTIQNQSNNLPVVFMNSYQNASLYEFYTGSLGISLNNIAGRKNQYDIWNYEDSIRGSNVMVVLNYYKQNFDTIPHMKKPTQFIYLNNFQSFSKMNIIPLNLEKVMPSEDTLMLLIGFENKLIDQLDFESNLDYPSYISYQFYDGSKLILDIQTNFKMQNDMLFKQNELEITTPKIPGNYSFCLSFNTGWLPPTINSKRYKVVIK